MVVVVVRVVVVKASIGPPLLDPTLEEEEREDRGHDNLYLISTACVSLYLCAHTHTHNTA